MAAHRDDVPPLFEAWLGKLLARDPGDRFSSAAAALDALAAIDVGPPAADDFSSETCETAVAAGDEAGALVADPGRWPEAGEPARAFPHVTSPVPRRVAAGDVQSIIRRAMELEAAGRDLLGHDTVLDIARELNVDSMFVREALRRHRESLEMPAFPGLTAGADGARRAERKRLSGGVVMLMVGAIVGLLFLSWVL